MPHCHNCGVLYNEGETTCSKCGSSLGDQASASRVENYPFEGASRPFRDIGHPLKRGKYLPTFLSSLWGILAGASLVLPLLERLTEVMAIPADLRSISRLVAFIACSFAILLSYTRREWLWEHELLHRVRSVRRIGINTMAILSLLGALLLWGGELAISREFAQSEYPERQFFIPAIYCLALGGLTASLSLLASLSCMKRLEEAKEYERPEYLRDDADLVKLVTPQVKEDLNIPAEEPLKVVFREPTQAGGLTFIIRCKEKVSKRDEGGSLRTVEEEREYQVEVNVRGKLVSLKEWGEKL